MTSDELRQAFLDFFTARQHVVVRSAPLVPIGDPTLLFTSAGMVPFKPYFLGRERPPASRLTSIQRCFRTTDIERVGDATHQTFFEMLGNFSVGDYYKQEAIPWAWEFVTQRLGIARHRLWITVYIDDDEAFDCWLAQGQPSDRVMRYGVEEGNYWFSGDVGPCGPCSEIYYDFGEDTGCGRPDCQPSHDCGRFLEIWNIVFMAFNRHDDGARTPLPAPNIDTGAGLERIASVLQHRGPGIASDYETDLLRPLVEEAARLAGKTYGEDNQTDLSCRIVADHSRGITFLIADGVLPSNEGRGYVLRRVLRRAVYFGRQAGMQQGALVRMAEAVIERMVSAHPHLRDQATLVTSVAGQEEGRFHETLDRGLQRLDEILAAVDRSSGALPGEEAFRLYDTYGLPKELTNEIAAMNGLRVDDAGFEAAMGRQREQARAHTNFSAKRTIPQSSLTGVNASESAKFSETARVTENTRFIGYERLTDRAETLVVGQEASLKDALEAGEYGWVVLDQTPFYPEGGGQVGDTGIIRTDTGVFIVEDTKHHEGGVIVHQGQVRSGFIRVNQASEPAVDPIRRQDVMCNHSGTHLLHAALREVLGTHAHQAGSLVAPERLRFDFTHGLATAPEQLLAVERLVNERVRDNEMVQTRVTTYDDAVARGALAFFGEKYGDEVRMVSIRRDDTERPFSAELCGGTHVDHTGQIGLMRIISEGGIGSGIRRIEALTGRAAEHWSQQQASLVERIAAQVGASPIGLEARIADLLEEVRTARQRLAALNQQREQEQAEQLLAQAEQYHDANVIISQVESLSVKVLRELGDRLRNRLGSTAIVLGAVIDGRPQFVVQVTPDLVQRGINAGSVVSLVASSAGGKGGGRPESAQGGGTDPGRLPAALSLARRLITEQLAR